MDEQQVRSPHGLLEQPGIESTAGLPTLTDGYVFHMDAEDYSGRGGGGEICCFTTAMMKVTVTQ